MPYDRITVYNTYAELISELLGLGKCTKCSARGLKIFVQRSLNLAGSTFLVIGALACFPLNDLLKEGRRISRVWAYSPSRRLRGLGKSGRGQCARFGETIPTFRTDTPSLAFNDLHFSRAFQGIRTSGRKVWGDEAQDLR